MPASPPSSQHSQSRPTGTPPRGGFHRLCAYIAMKVRGTRTQATATTAGCNSSRLHTGVWADDGTGVPTWIPLGSSYTGHGFFIAAMDARSESGAPPESAACDDAWERENLRLHG